MVSTNNNTGDGMIASSFDDNAAGIVVIRDGNTKEVEVNSWIPLTRLVHCEKIQGFISCGDEKQLRPSVISLHEDIKFNEFGQQLALSLPTRLARMGHPVKNLTEQFRYRSVFAKWPNMRTYDNQLQSHPSTDQIVANPGYLKAIRAATPVGPDANINMGNIVVSVDASSCCKDESQSRYNDAHRLFILQLLVANSQNGGYNGDEMTVITPYQGQVVRLRQSLFQMQEKGILPSSRIPTIATTDSMQGKESKLVIYDWVISAAEKFSDLGFTADDQRHCWSHAYDRGHGGPLAGHRREGAQGRPADGQIQPSGRKNHAETSIPL